MQILNNILSPSDISALKEYWDQNYSKAFVNGRPQGWHPLSHLADHVDRRLLIGGDTVAHTIIRKIVDQLFPAKQEPLWANYQRQVLPHTLHVDEYGRNRKNPTWTIVIALDNEPRHKTVLFKNQFNDGTQLREYLNRQCTVAAKSNNISSHEDLDHLFDSGFGVNLADYLDVEIVNPYTAGTGILFDTNQAHCTSNWRKYRDIAYRDLIQIHIGESSKDSYDEQDQLKYNGDPLKSVEEILNE